MKKIIIGNWKLNLDHLQGIQLLQKINYSLPKNVEENIDIVLAPSHTSLRSLQTVISADKLKIKLSSQDVSMFKEGAYTGEVSSTQLKKLDISYSIVGHSERRTLLNENDEIINQKLKRLQEQNITPIFCFGEPIENRENNTYLEFIQNQLNEGLMGIRKDNVNEIIFAYEPIWAIGTGQVATLENIIEVLDFTKNLISSKSFYDQEKSRFIYGGSVSPDNSEEILNLNIVDGALVGGASLDSDKFVKIVNSIKL